MQKDKINHIAVEIRKGVSRVRMANDKELAILLTEANIKEEAEKAKWQTLIDRVSDLEEEIIYLRREVRILKGEE